MSESSEKKNSPKNIFFTERTKMQNSMAHFFQYSADDFSLKEPSPPRNMHKSCVHIRFCIQRHNNDELQAKNGKKCNDMVS